MRVYDACVEVRGELKGTPLSCHHVGPGDEIRLSVWDADDFTH